MQPTLQNLAALYETDETAWLETMSERIRDGRIDQVDLETLAEYLTDMARRDRREVISRLGILIAHLLKWQHQPSHRSGSWRATIEIQCQELAELLESEVLRSHADSVLAKSYANAVRQAMAETDLPKEIFAEECPYTLEDVLTASSD